MNSWHDTAACLHHPLDLFFPTGNKPDYTAAKAICRTCPVREDCLNEALARRSTVGVFGGLTPGERQQLRGVAVWRDCVWCAQRFTHPDRLVTVCGDECREAMRSWQKRQSRARRSVA